MFLSWTVIIIFGFIIYSLYSKIKFLEKKSGELGTAKLVIRARNDLYDLPVIKELAGLDKKYHDTKFEDLPKAEKEKLRKCLKTLLGKLWISMRFFYDKNLIYIKQKDNSGFVDFPTANESIVYETLSDVEDDLEINFIIKYRVLKDIVPDRHLAVYTGYIKKEKSGERDSKEIIELFDFPDYFINPENYEMWKRHPELVKELEKKFELEHKEDRDFGDFKGDFGETEYFLGRGTWWESKYCELITN